jgi:predicted component of type VI protein secretion system
VVITPPQPPPTPTLAVKLRVIRGLRMNAEYPVYPGRNVIGRFADRPVDIDLTGIEPDGQVWSSRKHASLTLDRGLLVVEDLNSLNGTWVNGTRLRAGVALPLNAGDVIQIGVAQLRVDVESL